MLAGSIAIATELWLVVIAALSVAQIGSYRTARDTVLQYAEKLPKDAPDAERRSLELMSSTGMVIASLVVGVVIGAAIALVAMYFVRDGRNWARLLLSGLSAYVVVGALMAFFGPRTWTQAPEIIAGACALFALFMLMRRDADTYCREMTEFRAAARTPQPPVGHWPMPPQLPPQQDSGGPRE